MGDISSETTTNKKVLAQQKAVLDQILHDDSDKDDLMRELIEAVKELGSR